MTNRAVIAGVLVGVAAVAASWWSMSGDAGDPAAEGAQVDMQSSSGMAPMSQPATVAPAMPAASTSNAITVTDAMGLTLDASRLFQLGFGGGLLIDKETLASIEAVVNSMPNPPSEKDIALLERTLREGLPKDDAEKALKLINNYRAYTHAVTQETLPKGIPSTVAEAEKFFAEMDAVRRRHFDDATANALFGPEEGYGRLTMLATLVEQDQSLTPAQKKEQIDALRAQLPPEKREMIPDPSAAPAASQPGA